MTLPARRSPPGRTPGSSGSAPWYLLAAVGVGLGLLLLLIAVIPTRAPRSGEAGPAETWEGPEGDPGRPLVTPAPDAGGESTAASRAEPRAEVASEVPEARAALLLRVVDRATGDAAASRVELWQLDAAEPVRRAELEVPVEGARVEGLTPGSYRAFVVARRRASEDPPAFRVSAPLTEVELAVDLPLLRRVWLAAYDERGAPLPLARLASGYASRPGLASPPWGPGEGDGAGGAETAGGLDFGSRRVSATGEGLFDLGQVRDLDCDRSGGPWFELTPTARTPVAVELVGHELFSRDEYEPEQACLYLLGVSLPADWFDDAIRTPGGTRACDEGAQIRVRSEALTSVEPPAAQAWRSVPVRVEVELEGHEPLRFTYRLEDGPPERRALRLRR